MRDDLGYTHLCFTGPGVILSQGGEVNTSISFLIEEKNSAIPDAKAAIEYDISFLESLPLKDYQLLERSTFVINNIVVEQFINYQDAGVREYPEDPEPEPMPTIQRQLYFELDNMIWSITIGSNQAVADIAEQILVNLLYSLRILD